MTINGADLYGRNDTQILGYETPQSAIAASGAGAMNAEAMGGNGAISWLAFVALLVAIRVIWELAE